MAIINLINGELGAWVIKVKLLVQFHTFSHILSFLHNDVLVSEAMLVRNGIAKVL